MCSDWTRTITIRVGPGASGTEETRDFVVHEHILRAHSSLFEAALGRDWKESNERLIKLPAAIPHAFDIYVHWVYLHQLELTVENGVTGIEDLIDAYVLGDVLQDGDFRDRVIDGIMTRQRGKVDDIRAWVKHVYENTKEKDPLRTFAIDSVVYCRKESWKVSEQQNKDVPEEALWDIIATIHKANGNVTYTSAPFKKNLCHYHVHENVTCYKSRDG